MVPILETESTGENTSLEITKESCWSSDTCLEVMVKTKGVGYSHMTIATPWHLLPQCSSGVFFPLGKEGIG